MEYKTTSAYTTKLDDGQGIVETIFAVMGNVDKGKDRIWPGAFTKTFSESGHKVRVLDHHRTGTIMSVLGKPVELRELAKGELPGELLKSYPDATGGAWAKVQFLMDTPEGQGAFARIKSGAVDDWSFGYDALDHDYSKEDKDGEQLTVRNLRTVRLFELSPVLWGMNPATETLSSKAADQVGIFKEDGRWHLYVVDGDGKQAGESLSDYGSYEEAVDAAAKRNKPDGEEKEEKPWSAFEEEGKWVVYKVNEDGEQVGEALGTHDLEDEAQAQIRALYAEEKQEPPTTCVCPECGAEQAKERGVPCRGVDCPECGAKMEAKLEDKADKPSRYLVVEDSEKPSTWHLPVRDEGDKPDHRLMGAAWAALTVGYRGNKYEGPGKTEALAKLKKLYESEDMEPPSEKALEVAEIIWVYYQDESVKTEIDGLDELKSELKAGRVLAQRNIDRVEKAVEELIKVLRSAGLYQEEGPSDQLTQGKAGSDNPPTSKELALLMEGLEMELFQAAIELEV